MIKIMQINKQIYNNYKQNLKINNNIKMMINNINKIYNYQINQKKTILKMMKLIKINN